MSPPRIVAARPSGRQAINVERPAVNLDTALESGLALPDGVELLESPHRGEPVIFGEALCDRAFLDGQWRDVRLPPPSRRFLGEHVVQITHPLISRDGVVFLSDGTPLQSRALGVSPSRSVHYDLTPQPYRFEHHYNSVPQRSNAYAHWLLHRLPRLDTLLSVDASLPVLSNAGDWNDSSLYARFGIDSSRISMLRRKRGAVYAVESLRLATHAAPPARSRAVDMNRMRRAYENFAAGVATQPDSPQRIYVSRREKSGRRSGCTNGAELEQEFALRGFTVVYPEDYGIDEQISLFRAAEVVAAEMGSGAHNTVFSEQGTTVIYLTPSSGTLQNSYAPEDKSWMRAIADMHQQRFHQIVCNDSPDRQHWLADLQIVRSALNALEADGTI